MTNVYTERQSAPGHPELPVTFGKLTDFPDDPIACMRQMKQRHGEVSALVEDNQQLVFVFGPQWNQRVLNDGRTFHSYFFSIRGPRKSAQRRLTSGLLQMNEGEHKEHRRIVMGPFQKQMLDNYHEPNVEMTRQMLAEWKTGQVREIHRDMTQFMLRLTSAILFGLDEPEMAFRIGGMIDKWVQMNHVTGMGALVSNERFHEGYERLLELAGELEVEIREMVRLKRSRKQLNHDVLSLLLQAHERESRVDDEKLIGHVALLFGAAHLTTAHTLAWTLFLLAQHPSVMSELAGEITSSVAGDTPRNDEIGRMPLMERVIKESMRILPASSYLQRTAVRPVQLGPLSLSARTTVIFSQFITHHLPELYDQPERFWPDRWLTITPSAYAYFPFGAGSRMCVGGPMAMRSMQTTLPAILKRFRMTVVPNAQIDGRVVSTMLGPVSGIPMRLDPPDGRFQSQPVTGNIHSMVDLHQVAPSTRRAA